MEGEVRHDVFDTLVTNALVVGERGTERLDIGIRDGVVAAHLAPNESASAARIVDAKGRHLLPGAVDIHFHIRAPAYPDRGTVASETAAAAAGGITTLFEMPISKPCCATPAIFANRREVFENDALVDFALYGAPGTLRKRDVLGMVEEGAIGFKIFMTDPPKGRDDEFEGLCLPDEGPLFEALALVREAGLVTSVHAESVQLLRHFGEAVRRTGRNDAATHGEARPPVAEAVAIAKLLTMNEVAGARVHIAHVTSRAALSVLRKFQDGGMDVTGETCPQYLLFDETALAEHGAYAKINPPLRAPDDRDALWSALADGTLTAVATDHSPFTLEEKEKARTDIWGAPPGAPGAEELLLTLLDAVCLGRLTIEDAVRLVSTNGAKRFGLYPKKGSLEVGSDADLVIVDLDETTTIRKEQLVTQARMADRLYDGRRFQGRICMTLVRGAIVYEDGAVKGEAGWGTFQAPLRSAQRAGR